MKKFKFRLRNRHNFFQWLYVAFESSPKIKFGIFLGLLFPLIYLLIRVMYSDRIKVIVLDDENDIDSSLPQGRWNIEGWEFVNYANFHLVFTENGISTRGFENEAENGLWLASKKIAAGDSLTFVLDNFQYYYPVETTIGLRFYIGGSAKLEILVRDSSRWEINTYAIIPNHQRGSREIRDRKYSTENDDSLFCSHIVPLCFDGLVDRMEIKAKFESDDGFVAIDSVFMTMGKHGGSRNLMLTMIPSNWCTKEYLYSWNPYDPESTNYPKIRNVMRYR